MRYIVQLALTDIRQVEIDIDVPLADVTPTDAAIASAAIAKARNQYGSHDETEIIHFERSLIFIDQGQGEKRE